MKDKPLSQSEMIKKNNRKVRRSKKKLKDFKKGKK